MLRRTSPGRSPPSGTSPARARSTRRWGSFGSTSQVGCPASRWSWSSSRGRRLTSTARCPRGTSPPFSRSARNPVSRNPVSRNPVSCHLFARNPVRVIRCRFIFSGKNDELTPDYASSAAAAPLAAHIRPLFLPDLVQQIARNKQIDANRREQAHPVFRKWAKDLKEGVLQQLHETQVEQDFNHVLLRGLGY